jgi:hypothetical protein
MNAAWERRANSMKLIGEALQPFIVIVSALGAVVTFTVSETDKAHDRAKEAIDRAEARSAPYYQRQLDIYAEATRIAARLASLPDTDPSYPATVARFWELYWGDLGFVESSAIAAKMASICRSYVSKDKPERCAAGIGDGQGLALDLAHLAANEIKARWVEGGK